jgi:hypothetical protein
MKFLVARDQFDHASGGDDDYRRVNSLSRDHSTLQIGLRWRF